MFSRKKKGSTLGRSLATPIKGEDLSEFQDFGYGMDSDVLQQQPAPRRVYPQYSEQQLPEQQRPLPLQPRSIAESNHEMIINRLEAIEVKIDSLLKRLDMIERVIQSRSQQQPAPYKDDQRRIW